MSSLQSTSNASSLHTPRNEAGSMTLPGPTSTSPSSFVAQLSSQADARAEVAVCGGNPQLLEARLLQMTCSIRALVKSNAALEEALKEDPDDPDFQLAVEENKLTIRRQGLTAKALVAEMQANGCNIDLEADVQDALDEVSPERIKVVEVNVGGNNAAANGGTNNATTATNAAASTSVNSASLSATLPDNATTGGVYL